MTTAELIPLILLELNESDKYGFELTKSIETKSNGQIVIKQPTLYTVLKKLEKSKFISSYWQDSDIGGKRHYYKITNNGRMQVSTLPSFDVLLKQALTEEIENNSLEISQNNNINNDKIEENSQTEINVNDMSQKRSIENADNISILPSELIFADDNIDTLTEIDINNSNLDMLKSDSEKQEEEFATNENVSRFTESSPEITNEQKQNIINLSTSSEKSNENQINIDNYIYSFQEDTTPYIDYIDLRNDQKHIYAKNTCKRLFYRALSSCTYLLIMVMLTFIINNFVYASSIYYTSVIISFGLIIFVPTLFIFNYQKIRLKLKEKEYQPNFKKHIILSIIIVFAVTIICFIANVINDSNQVLSLSNFLNFYAPILFSSVALADVLFNYLFIKKFNRSNEK